MNVRGTLSAIMFTDIVGYTALVVDREDEARALLEKNRTVQKPLIARHQGLLLKEIDDGMLISFSSATTALRCALEIQENTKKHSELDLRIGIDLGEVDYSAGEADGQVVQTVFRLEPMSVPGGITVSEAVYRSTRGKFEITWESLGEKRLKNLENPLKIYRYLPNADVPAQKKLSWGLLRRLFIAAVVAALIGLAIYRLFLA